MTNCAINIACWSIGQHAIKNMLPAIDNSKDINLVGIYTRSVANSLEQSNLYDCKQNSDPIDLLNDKNVDAVYLSSPTGVHAEQILKCLNSGKSVLVEKTALPSVFETSQLIQLAQQNGLVIMEAFMYRFHNQFIALKQLIESKKYGEIIKIDCEFGFPHLNRTDIRYNGDLCGGSTYDAGAYTLSAARYLLGDKAEVVWAKTISKDDFDVDTQGYAMLESNSRIANCTWVFGASYSNKIRIWCEQGHILCDRAFSKSPSYSSSLIITHNGSVVETIDTGSDDHFIKMLTYFSNLILTSNFKDEHLDLLEQAKLVEQVFSHKNI